MLKTKLAIENNFKNIKNIANLKKTCIYSEILSKNLNYHPCNILGEQ